jgi:hypothetical protein
MNPVVDFLRSRAGWRLNHAKQLFLLSAVTALVAIPLLASRYSATPDEALTVTCVFMTVTYAMFRAIIATMPRSPIPASSPSMAARPHIFILAVLFLLDAAAAFYAIALIVTAVFLPFVRLARFAPAALQGVVVLTIAGIAIFFLILLYVAGLIAWPHRWRVFQEGRRIVIKAQRTVRSDVRSHWAH